jgi:ubiquinone/menaquinone biosynthesis C-methylase UbiE
MNARQVNFDPLARVYRMLELFAFGRDLERARFCHLDALASCDSILILGEGDGRFVSRLVQLRPQAEVLCIDSSAAMIAQARSRLAIETPQHRVKFQQADARSCSLPAQHFDAAVTLFFLDCFTHDQAETMVTNIAQALRPSASWLFADFSMPERGLARMRAKLWLNVLYPFFNLSTGLRTRALPNVEPMIERAGFAPVAVRSLQAGLLRSVVFRRKEIR